MYNGITIIWPILSSHHIINTLFPIVIINYCPKIVSIKCINSSHYPCHSMVISGQTTYLLLTSPLRLSLRLASPVASPQGLLVFVVLNCAARPSKEPNQYLGCLGCGALDNSWHRCIYIYTYILYNYMQDGWYIYIYTKNNDVWWLIQILRRKMIYIYVYIYDGWYW